MFKNKKIMIVVAHPDDEILGLGATMHRLINNHNVKTHLLILGEGITSRSNKRDLNKWSSELKIHKENIMESKKLIGYHSISINKLPDNRFDSLALLDLIKLIEKEKKKFKPDIVFTHHHGDLNIDHRMTFEAVITSCRPVENEKVKTIITFETPSSTDWMPFDKQEIFKPNFFFEVKKIDLEIKIKAMENYFAHKSAVIDKGSKIGQGTKIWHFSHIMKSSKIGNNCNIGQNVFIASGYRYNSSSSDGTVYVYK